MILIADSGSTKTSWLLVDKGDVVQDITTSGYNPYYYKNTGLLVSIKSELLSQLRTTEVDKIFFYGSGCSSDTNCTMVKSALWQLFPNSQISVNHDLYGAALALLNNDKGIACILGTGSNSCNWDGYSIIQNIPSVGYLLGDEGSGTYMGMKILKGILENKAPSEIANSFYNEYNITFEGVLNRIYHETKPNLFISEISIFAKRNINNIWIRSVVKQSFIDFIENQIKHYDNYQNLKVSFTGSIAFHFKQILLEACNDNNITVGRILKNPIEGLFTYHANEIVR